jgi:hypothetical protein
MFDDSVKSYFAADEEKLRKVIVGESPLPLCLKSSE